MYYRVALSFAVAFLAMTCIHPGGAFGQSSKIGNGDFCVHLNGGTDVAHAGMMNTLEIYIANDALLAGMTPAIEISFYCAFSWDMGYGSHPPVNEEGRAVGAWDNFTGLMITQDFDDLSPEHIGFGGAAFPGGGLPDGPSDICYSLQFYIPGSEGPNPSGICVQPYFYPPSYQWIFADAGGNYPPDFCGQPVADPYDPVANPICFEIINQPPEIINCPTSPLRSNYCDVAVYDFEAYDLEGDPFWFEIISGFGAVDANGVWTYAPSAGDVGYHTIEIMACDQYGCGPICYFEIEITNEPPYFTSGCGIVINAQPGQTVFNQLTADDPNYCGPLLFSLEAADPPPTGPATIDPATGLFVFQPEVADTGTTMFVVQVHDEVGDYDVCSFEVDVVQPYGIVINEVLPWADIPDDGDTVSHTVELYNAGTSAQDLIGWRIAGASLANEILLPDWSMPAGTYLIVNFGIGTDDSDFSDSVATYYAHNLNWAFDNYADEVGLYSGFPGSQTIVDFVGWGRGGSTFGEAYSHARQSNMWPVDDFVELDGESLLGTFGRIPSGYDTDSLDDWRVLPTPRVTPTSPDNPIQLMPRDGSVNLLLVDHVWRAVHDASSYLLEVDNDSTFSSPFIVATLSDTAYTGGYPVGWYYWRVSPDIPDGPYPAAEWSFVVDTGSTPGSNELAVLQEFQHKDTQLLCIWNQRKGTRPGCSELPGKKGPWDGEHSVILGHISGCEHCALYCTRAAIQMVNKFFGGSLTQDEISYKMFESKALGPEGDLGHFKGTHIPEELGPYAWAMGTGVALVDQPPLPVIPWGDLKDEIDAGRPILALIRAGNICHAVVFCGYDETSSGRKVKIMDPWPGYSGEWQYTRIKVVRYYVLQPGINARAGDPNVSANPDGDGIMSFDEGVPRPFNCSANKKDTDDDQVDDKCEIRNYTFHNQPGYHPGCVHNNLSVSIADIDGDGLRAEGDCDSDNDTQFDGGEDSDGDGYNPVIPPADETCQFMDANFHIGVSVDKDVYAFGEPVHIVDIPGARETRTYHVNSLYNIEMGVGLPLKMNGDAIAHNFWFPTDADGRAIPWFILHCHNIGINHLYVDILDDGKYSFPFNWDPYCSWECDDIPFVGWHIGITIERFIEGFEWPLEYPTVCPSGGEIIDVDIFTPWWWYSEWPQPTRDYWLGVSVPADLLTEETIWIETPPSFVNQMDECSGTEIIPFVSDAMIELDLNEQFGDEDTYWYGFEITGWQLPDSLMVTDVVITMLQDAARGDEIPIQIRMGDSDYGWSPAYYRSIGIPSGPAYICGDADGSGGVDIDDVVYLINYIFAGGPAPEPLEAGDADCSGAIDIDDVVYLIGYIFSGGNAPCDPNGDTVPDC